MNSEELRKRFLEFFKKRGHAIVPSSSLLPDDPSVLLTTAGMQQFKPYYTGAADPMVSPHPTLGGKPLRSKNAASIQKSFRTSDIDEVGDERHLTFFEMMGNFSFGGYFKKEAIQYAYDFITKELGLKIDYVSVFGGEKDILADLESEQIWKSLDSGLTVKKFGRADNFWGPTGKEGPCGPTTEVYIDGIEIWNIVFNEYYQNPDGSLVPIETKGGVKGIDTGMGLERLAMVSQFPGQAGVKTIFDTDLFMDLMPNGLPTIMDERIKHIMLDHARAIAFLISDGVRPSNKDQGYVLRRIIRRTMAHFHQASLGSFNGKDILGIDFLDIENLLRNVVKKYGEIYKNLNRDEILSVFRQENDKFRQAINSGLRELKKIAIVDAKLAFKMFESYGLTFEIIKDFAREKAQDLKREDFEEEFKKHQELSRAGKEKKFGGHGLLLDTGELKAANEEELKIVTRLHTTTHLLQSALRKVLGESVHQAGSDITTERTRFDFTFERKVSPEELQKVEDVVNGAIQDDLNMGYEEMPFEKAIQSGALYSPKEKYPAVVKVYTAQNLKTGEVFSKELCGGPHVADTGEIGHIKIIKEEAASAGIRRVRAVLA